MREGWFPRTHLLQDKCLRSLKGGGALPFIPHNSLMNHRSNQAMKQPYSRMRWRALYVAACKRWRGGLSVEGMCIFGDLGGANIGKPVPLSVCRQDAKR